MAAVLTTAPGPGIPQTAQDDGGITYTFGFSNEFRGSDNRQLSPTSLGNSFYSETELSFGVAARSRYESFDFDISNRFRFGTGPGAPDDQPLLPGLALNYTREALNALVSVDARVTTRDLSIDDVPDNISDPTELITDSGIQINQRLAADLELGRTSAVGSAFSLYTNRTNYTDATDPDLYDRDTIGGSAALILRPGQATTLRLSYDLSEFDAEDTPRTHRVTQSFDLGAERQLNQSTLVTGSFGWKTVDETLRALNLDGNDNEGYIAAVGLARDLPTGQISADLSHDVTGAGDRTDFSITRAFDLPAGGLELTLGVTEPEGAGLQPTGGIVYRYEGLRQTLRIDASTRIIVADDDTVQRASRIRLDYDIAINQRDDFGASLAYNRSDDAGGAGNVNEVQRTSATARYTRALTEDWDLTTGYTHRFRNQENSGEANASEIFVSLGRSFSWRP